MRWTEAHLCPEAKYFSHPRGSPQQKQHEVSAVGIGPTVQLLLPSEFATTVKLKHHCPEREAGTNLPRSQKERTVELLD